MSKQPNFLFIITDQQRADHLGCYGNSVVKTPNIDKIATRGKRWDRFYVANPICMPNRASIMTGRMCSSHGARHNGIPLSQDHTTFVELLKDAGYDTGLIGKSHLQSFTGLAATNQYTDDPNKHNHVEVAAGHGDQACGDYLLWAREQNADFDNLTGKSNALRDNRIDAPQAWRTQVPEELYSTNWIADRSCDWLGKRANDDSPFFLQMSFPDPHHPFTPPGKYWDMYDPKVMSLPESFGAGDSLPIQRMRKALAEGTDKRSSQDPFAVTKSEARAIIALTYGMITMIDDAIGRVLKQLQQSGLAENTIVVFTSDHGDYMGDHGLMLKLLLHYQGLIRVPFIWHDPRNPANNTITSELSSSIDIAPTILEAANIQAFNGIQGRDLFDGNPPDAVIVEEDSQRSMIAFEDPQRIRTVVTERYRMSLREGEDWDELYDLQNDPYELNNCYEQDDMKDIRAELTETMLKRVIALQDRAPLPAYRA